MTGKQKCAILRQIRRDIAAKNDISITISECKHQGNCLGTCPKCESEVAELEKALDARRKKGKQVVLAGISAGLIAANCSACDLPFKTETQLNGDLRAPETEKGEKVELDGDLAVVDTSEKGEDDLMGEISAEMPEDPNEKSVQNDGKYEIAGIMRAPDTFEDEETDEEVPKN